jgi:hypothetical protein
LEAFVKVVAKGNAVIDEDAKLLKLSNDTGFTFEPVIGIVFDNTDNCNPLMLVSL